MHGLRAEGRGGRLQPRVVHRLADPLAGLRRLHVLGSRRDGAHRRRNRGHQSVHASRHDDRERVRDARRALPGPARARHRARRQRGADDGAPSRQDLLHEGVDSDPARSDRREDGHHQRHRGAPPLGRRGSRDPDHDVGDRAAEPPPRRFPGRPRDAVRRGRGNLRAVGDGARSRRCRRGRAEPRRDQVLPAHRHVGRRRPGGGLGQVPLGPRCVREPHRRHDAAQPVPRHARDDDAIGAEPRRLRLLRGPSRRRPTTRGT